MRELIQMNLELPTEPARDTISKKYAFTLARLLRKHGIDIYPPKMVYRWKPFEDPFSDCCFHKTRKWKINDERGLVAEEGFMCNNCGLPTVPANVGMYTVSELLDWLPPGTYIVKKSDMKRLSVRYFAETVSLREHGVSKISVSQGVYTQSDEEESRFCAETPQDALCLLAITLARNGQLGSHFYRT